MDKELLTYKQASGFLQIQLGTLYSLVSQRRIPHIRLSNRMVRFRRSDIEKWIANQEVSAKEIKTKSIRGGANAKN